MSRKNGDKNKFIPYDKMGKRDKREIDQQKRKNWGNINPTTKPQGEKNDYRRKKQREREDDMINEYDYNFD